MTPLFRSPETASDAEPALPRELIEALGRLLGEMLADQYLQDHPAGPPQLPSPARTARRPRGPRRRGA